MEEIILSVFVALEDMNTDPKMRVGKVLKRGERAFLPLPEWALHLELELSDFAPAPELQVTVLHLVGFPGGR